jgi:biotin carboxylase
MGHTIPSAIEAGAYNDDDDSDNDKLCCLIKTFFHGIKTLGVSNGAAKGDIKLTSRGPMIGEIAARLSGGYMSGWTYPYSSGVLPTKGAIEIALGNNPSEIKPEWNWTSAERAFISIPGKVQAVKGAEKAKAMPWIKDVFLRIRAGSAVIFPENNVSKCGNIISAAPNREDAVNSAEKAARSILIRLEAPNDDTAAFLAVKPGETQFPPDAFP